MGEEPELRERDIVEVTRDVEGAAAGTQGVVTLDWTDGRYEVLVRDGFAPVTVARGDLALLARPVEPGA